MGGGYFLVKVTGKNLREMVSQGRTRRDQFPFFSDDPDVWWIR